MVRYNLNITNSFQLNCNEPSFRNRFHTIIPGPGGGNSHIKRTWALVGNFGKDPLVGTNNYILSYGRGIFFSLLKLNIS